MCEKLRKVNSWLEGVFGDQPVPSFEVNTRTLDILYQLAQSSEARCSDTALLIEDYKQKTSEYQADAAHLEDVLLHGVGLSGASLSEPTANYVSALVDNAMVGVKDTSLTSFMPAINNLTDDLLEVEKSNRKLERELRALQKRLGSILVLRGNLQEDIDKTTKSQAVESAKEEERLLNMDFVTAKTQELRIRQQRLEAQLVSRNMDKSITHQAIVQLSEELRALQNEIIPLKKKLGSYMDLSPSPSLAQVKIEEAKRELVALDSKLETMKAINEVGCCAVLSLKIKFLQSYFFFFFSTFTCLHH
ncbi:HAUS augmin-like complex subunit 1 isoform X2 [Poeciliopsis prolifica]|uniref:HAUS augmin-like complex subunit 1 isoform X2 n=1 Tax=Poeciliopsis prolifica TaxID=188132 RepID=UPI002413BBBB|nr:HAUS augmin-like complex subunit 1 isoform X2 [Poeciliopsis prolifica]